MDDILQELTELKRRIEEARQQLADARQLLARASANLIESEKVVASSKAGFADVLRFSRRETEARTLLARSSLDTDSS